MPLFLYKIETLSFDLELRAFGYIIFIVEVDALVAKYDYGEGLAKLECSTILQLCDSWSHYLGFLYFCFLICQVKLIPISLNCIKIKN